MGYEPYYVSAELNISETRIKTYADLFEKYGHKFNTRDNNPKARLFTNGDILLFKNYLKMIEKYPKSSREYLAKCLFHLEDPLNINEKVKIEKVELSKERNTNSYKEIINISTQQLNLIGLLKSEIEFLKKETILLSDKITVLSEKFEKESTNKKMKNYRFIKILRILNFSKNKDAQG